MEIWRSADPETREKKIFAERRECNSFLSGLPRKIGVGGRSFLLPKDWSLVLADSSDDNSDTLKLITHLLIKIASDGIDLYTHPDLIKQL